MSKFAKFKAAYQSQAIVKDDSNLKDYVANNMDKKAGHAVMRLTAIESKWVVSNKLTSQGGAAHRTTFHTINKEGKPYSIGTFAGAAHRLYATLAKMTFASGEEEYGRLDFAYGDGGGYVDVGISIVELDGGHTTYNFEMLDGNIEGMNTYVPTIANIFDQQVQALPDGTKPALNAGSEPIDITE